MATEQRPHLFVVMCSDRAASARVRDRLAAAISPTAAGRVAVTVAGDGPAGARLKDALGDTEVVCLLDHHDPLPALAPFVAARLIVALPPGTPISPYTSDNVWEVIGDAEDLCELVLDAWADAPSTAAGSRLFVRVAAAPGTLNDATSAAPWSVAPGMAGLPARTTAGLLPAAALRTVAPGQDPPQTPTVPGRPVRLGFAATPRTAAPAGRSPGAAPRRAVLRLALRIARRAPRYPDLGQYAQWLLHPDYRAPVIVVCNPKGGPGKTTTAIGIALILDQVLEQGHANGRVVLVDGNTRMSDTFRSMPVSPDAPTVRALTRSLRAARDGVPELQHANARARNLVVLREDDDAGGYQLQEVDELARYLRRHFAAIVVDLVNDLPGTGSPTERLVQWWLLQASVVVIPTKANLNDFEGAERMAAACDGVPTIAAYIRPPHRRLDRHPRVRARLERLRELVTEVYTIPEDYRVRTAALDNLNLTDASSAIRNAFADLALGAVAVHTEVVYARLTGLTTRPPSLSAPLGPFGPLESV